MIMDRCIVKGCTTGLFNNTKNKETLNGKQNLLFKVPNVPGMLNKWRTALGQIIEPGDKVCELHFNKDDILKNLSTFSKLEGQKTLTFRKRVCLKQGAVPIPKDPLEIPRPIYSQRKEHVYFSEDDDQSDDVGNESITHLLQLSNGKCIEEYEINEVDQYVFNQQYKVEQDTNENQKRNKYDKAHRSEPKERVEQNIILISSDDDVPKKSQGAKEKIMANRIKNGVLPESVIQSSKPKYRMQNLHQKRKLNHSNSINSKVSKSDPSDRITCYDELKLYVEKRCVRQQWCVKIEQNSIFFYYIDFHQSRVNCCLEVAQDFTVNAYTADKVIAIYVTTTGGVSSISELVEIMKVLEKKKWCLGPGIPGVNRSLDCIGAMPGKSVSDNCTACIKEKLNSLTHTRELASCRIKLEESRHKYELMRKKHHYVNTQYEKVKSENKLLEYQVDEAKKMAVNEVLNKLPLLQQCVVRYIIHASYTTKSSLRYNTAWINECLVMKAMSPSLYEYLRQKEILPLPCPETLKKHRFNAALAEKETMTPISDDSIDYSKLPESPEVPEAPEKTESTAVCINQEISESTQIPVSTEMSESTQIPVSTEISESLQIPVSTEMPESTNPDDYVINITPEIIITEDVAYEVTICTESIEQEQYC